MKIAPASSVNIFLLAHHREHWSDLNWVVGSGDGAGQLPVPGRPVTLAYGRTGACFACSRFGTGGLFNCFISSILSSFSNASSLGRRLDILIYCGLGRYNPTVVVRYYQAPVVR